jgi:gluconolactonase
MLTLKRIAMAGVASALLGQAPRNFAQYDPPKAVTIGAIPGVVGAGAQWQKVWQGDHTADGMSATPDGSLIMSQEQTDTINKLDKDDKYTMFLNTAHGPGSATFGADGNVYAVERSCTDPGGKPETCTEWPAVTQLTPKKKLLANSVNGKTLGRLNDLTVSTKGHIYFTSGGAFHMTPSGQVRPFGNVVNPATNIVGPLFTNGIVLSPDEKTLYITNRATIVAFDIREDGTPMNQRDFAKLTGPNANGDGLAVDAQGRLYVTCNGNDNWTVQVFGTNGAQVGVIPTPRSPITLAFAGPDKKWLYIGGMGHTMADGKEFTTAPGVRNTAMTVFKLAMQAEGYKGRAK